MENLHSQGFIDVDLDTMGLSPKALKEFLEQNVELKNDGSYNKKTGKRFSNSNVTTDVPPGVV